jgi:hypothetical protein
MNHPVQLSHCSLSCKNRMRSGLTAPSLILSHFFAASRTSLSDLFIQSLNGLLPLNEGCRKSGTNYQLLSFIQ